jgi:alanyl-tRNA synthetase
MVGMFSFRGLTLKETIDFWLEFIEVKLDLKLDYVTVHPKKVDWSKYYGNRKIVLDEEWVWSDGGDNEGYCTEFYIDGVEIGNIVNTNGDCIDVGFGFERLCSILYGTKIQTEVETLEDTITKIIESGYTPKHNKQGYVLKKLLRVLVKKGGHMENEYFHQEVERQEKLLVKYERLKLKHKNKSKEWWFDTHGIDIDYNKRV